MFVLFLIDIFNVHFYLFVATLCNLIYQFVLNFYCRILEEILNVFPNVN